MFRSIESPKSRVGIVVDGKPFEVDATISVAAALLGLGMTAVRRSVVTDEPRGPYCLMGICFECLVTIDGVQNRQACMVPVREGMVISSQRGARVTDGGGR
ncbi:(2Fe-2S)-binding protein [Shinella sp.]|uniref:(2Fe-2S)-binding protein n=1 Tax=Shinella sp. TaxID=1870904 RepID=UPI0028AC6113|nr:(2Fe-2S)-binding protein [Shinella sp.]